MKNKVVENRIMKLVKKNFLQFNISEFPKFNFKTAKIISTIICGLKALKSIFSTQIVEYFTTIAHCYIYATEEIKASRECTTSNITSTTQLYSSR